MQPNTKGAANGIFLLKWIPKAFIWFMFLRDKTLLSLSQYGALLSGLTWGWQELWGWSGECSTSRLVRRKKPATTAQLNQMSQRGYVTTIILEAIRNVHSRSEKQGNSQPTAVGNNLDILGRTCKINLGDRDPQTNPGHCSAALGHGSIIVNTKLLCSFLR